LAALLRTSAAEWRSEAACRGLNPDLFFSARGDTSDVRKAKAVCAECPVREPCLEYALDASESVGTWAGTTPRERQRMRAGRQRVRSGDTS
jgi:WhiB family transcriptional regulator, redox-sensing transcriptional regulator